MTRWVSSPSWPAYEISEEGRVRRVVVGAKGGFVGERKPYLSTTGYLMIVMRHDGASQACGIHRLVAEAFIGPPPFDGAQVAHGDGNKQNNHWSNLRYATRSENEGDKVSHGRSNRGERQGRSRLRTPEVYEIKARILLGEPDASIADDYGVARQTIRSICTGQSWSWL